MPYQQYDTYKDSGVFWLGKVPEYWTELPIKAVTTPVSIKNKPNAELLSVYRDYGVIIKSSRDDNNNKAGQDLSAYKYVQPSNLVLNKMKTWQGSLGVSEHEGIVSPAYIVCKTEQTKVFPRYLNHLLRCKNYIYEYNRLSYGIRTDQWDMRYDDFKNIPLFLPPLEEQKAIAEFIDKKTSQIDTHIDKQERLIALLKERRTAIINKAVTRGVDENVKLKDSGIDWLGEIPEHWSTKKIKYLFKIKKRIAGKTGLDVLSITQNGIRIKDITSGEGQLSMDYSKYQIVQKNDFAMNHMDLLTGFVDISSYDGVTSPDYRVFSLCDEKQLREYFLYLFQIGYKNKIFYAFGQGSSQLGRWRFPADEFNNFFVPLPPYDEQKKIVEFLEKENQKTNKHIAIIEKEISSLKEYRQSLISNAVTGKIRVI